MLNPSKQRLALGLALTALSLLLASCGSSGQNQQGREALRFNPTLPPAYIEDRYEYALVADGGQRPYRYTLNGTLPKGLTYTSGRITGVPTEKGDFELNATVEDGNLSSRAVKLTLKVSDTPPPQFDQFVPNSEQDSPFVYGLRIRARESRGFQMQVPLTDLRPTLDTLKAADGVLYVVRYNQERNLMDIDVAFTQPRTNFEAYRLSIAPVPDKKVRFAVGSVLIALYDKNGKLVTGFQPMERQTTEGRYKYEDLQTLARNWGKGVPQTQPTGQTAPPAQTPAGQNPPTTEGQGATPPAQTPATPASPEQPAGATGQPGQAQPTQPGTPAQTPPAPPETTPPAPPEQPAQGQPEQPAQGQPTQPAQPQQPAPPTQPAQGQPTQPNPTPAAPTEQPAQGQPNPPAQGQTAQPGQAQPAQPGQAQPTQPASPTNQNQPAQTQPGQSPTDRLEGDFNNDGRVDQKDLEVLRASYAWANVGNPTPRPPQNPQTNPNQPNQNQPNQTPPNQNPPPNQGGG